MQRFLILIGALFIFSILNAQNKPSSFSFKTEPASQYDYTIEGYGGTFSDNETYHLYFGTNASGSQTNDIIMTDFTYSGNTYTPITYPNGECYSDVEINRVTNNTNGTAPVTDTDKQTLFYEEAGNSGKDYYFTPSYTEIQEAVNKRILNRGGDNVFSNSNSQTINNIERIDLIIENGVSTPDKQEAGFLINERGGNDAFKVAAITSLDGSNKVDGLGSLVNVSTNDWGNTGRSVTTTVFQRTSNDSEMRPSQELSSQEIHGVFMTYDDLGISNNTTIYGIALFPGDVNSTMDLIDLTDVPLNTNGTSGNTGGLDLMGGGGYFGSQNVQVSDLETRLSAAPMNPSNGNNITLTAKVFNNGPQDNDNINVTVNIPHGYKFQSISSTSSGSVTYGNNSSNNFSKTITWTINTLTADNNDSMKVIAKAKNNGNRNFESDVTGQKDDVSPDNNDYSLPVSTTDDAPLPVSLTSFRGENNGNVKHIEWSTASEMNNNYFVLQKSANGKDYQSITQIDGAGNSNSVNNYSFRDQNPLEPVTYYKLKQIDFDGQSETFEPITVKTTDFSQNELNIYPNPADNHIFVQGLQADAELILVNHTGKIVYRKNADSFKKKLSLDHLSPGIYFLKTIQNEKVRTRKLILK